MLRRRPPEVPGCPGAPKRPGMQGRTDERLVGEISDLECEPLAMLAADTEAPHTLPGRRQGALSGVRPAESTT